MKIESCRYTLEFREDFAMANQGALREGSLLRMTFDDGLTGYCDCHPWVSLGDLPLSGQLQTLAAGKSTPLLDRSLEFARLDAVAREAGRSLFEGLIIPESHLLISTNTPLDRFVEEGISHFKLKVGANPADEIAAMQSKVKPFPRIRLRLDFNARLSRQAFHDYWRQIPLNTRSHIDFVEDPYPFHPQTWAADQTALSVAFAADHLSERSLHHPDAARYLIFKPAVQDLSTLVPPTRFVVTSYLDHPFGQMCAAYSAAKLSQQFPDRLHLCGLLTHHCYKQNPFIAEMSSQGPFLQPTTGTGFGFDLNLKECAWQKL